jgi:predicted short-subunit dehydrogenase-like oxidoreductase (DUF2520 family)
VAIIGAGVVGSALAALLRGAGYAVGAVASRTEASARALCRFASLDDVVCTPAEAAAKGRLVFLTTPDAAIGDTCAALAGARAFRRGACVIHCSGALPSTVLLPARERCGAVIASLHPCQSFAGAAEAVEGFAGTRCACEGDAEAMPIVERVVRDTGGVFVPIATEAKTLYHAAAAVVSNYLVTLIDSALTLMEGAGVQRAEALAMLLPLVRGTVRNVEGLGIPNALTGPIARGDVGTVASHLRGLTARAPAILPLYREVGRWCVRVGRAKGTLTEDDAARIRGLFDGEA